MNNKETCEGMGNGTRDGSGQGRGAGRQGQGRGRSTNDDVQVSAVLEKLVMVEDRLIDKLELVIDAVDANVELEVGEINRKLFDNITKKELVEGILDGDALSVNGLLEREDVQNAIQATQNLHVNAFQTAVGIGGKIHKVEQDIMNETHNIALDVVIHGCTDDIKDRLLTVEQKVDGSFEMLLNQ